MTRTITIATRFNGPPGSGNGGYVCGLLAREITGPSQATLRVPPPLEKPLTLASDGQHATLHDGDTLVGEARAVAFDLKPLTPPSLSEARDAQRLWAGLLDHRYPTCFVCGNQRPLDDGLDIYPGNLESRNDIVACTWTPAADLADANGIVRAEFIHAALDCPSYWALAHAGKPALLASLTASIDAPLPRASDDLIIAAWPIKEEGRKHWGAAALYTANGATIARAEALWIEPKQT